MKINTTQKLASWSSYLDKELLTVVLLLLGLGFIVMTSASVAISERAHATPSYFMDRQLLFIGMGFVLALITYQIRMSYWQSLGVGLIPIIFALLVIVLIPDVGQKINGSRRWIGFGGFNIQVSELAKLVIFLYLAGYMVRHDKKLVTSTSYKPMLMPLLVLALFGALLLLEPDFGTVVVVFATGLALLFLGGVRLIQLAVLLLGIIILMIPLLMMGYRGNRVMSFFDPWKDSTGTGYQVTNALMAIGDGGWFGSGLGGSVQKQFYLPEAHNDFIFAVLADELGFIGITITLGLFGWLVQRAFVIGFKADKAQQYYGAYVAYAIGFWMGFQALFHIGVNLAVLPPKGLTLPFMSYGGSSMLVALTAMGVLMRVHTETEMKLRGVPIEKAPPKKTRRRTTKKVLKKSPKKVPKRATKKPLKTKPQARRQRRVNV
ncbi:MAG TPA: putative lipid II flippase FtsW [Thiothrix sp.]|nr:putative lipid II flippase FtsW [Thiothrix sp.]